MEVQHDDNKESVSIFQISNAKFIADVYFNVIYRSA